MARLELTPKQWQDAQTFIQNTDGGIPGAITPAVARWLAKKGFRADRGFRQTTLPNGNIVFEQDASDPELAQE